MILIQDWLYLICCQREGTSYLEEMVASQGGHAEAVDHLLRAGAEPNAQNNEGDTKDCTSMYEASSPLVL